MSYFTKRKMRVKDTITQKYKIEKSESLEFSIEQLQSDIDIL